MEGSDLGGDMQLSVATATYYFLPFRQALEIIVEAGFEHVELDLYWEQGPWAVAQHLKGVDARAVAGLLRSLGLRVSSIHDAGGVLGGAHSLQGFIDPRLDEFIQALGYAPGCIVFHTPHIAGPVVPGWWPAIAGEVAAAAERYLGRGTSVTLENMPQFDGYEVPLATPEALLEFVASTGLGITLDTTHYAQVGVEVVQAARRLRPKVQTLHLSDFAKGQAHVFVGDGELDFPALFAALDFESLYAVTLECSAGRLGENPLALSAAQMVERLQTARRRLQAWLKAA